MRVRERDRARARERLEALAASDLRSEEARFAAIEVLRPVVGFDRWCWPSTDPRSALATGGVAEFDLWQEVPRMAVLEEYGDVTRKAELVVGPRASVALSAATGGDLARSTRWRECLRPYGVGDELMTACRDRHGCWGSVELMRDAGDRPFDEEDERLLDDLAPVLGTLLRRSQRHDSARVPGAQLAPATLILDALLAPAGWTPSFHAWLEEMGTDMLPPAVYELGTRVLTPAAHANGLPASVRLRSASGRWVTLEGAALEGESAGNVAITIRESAPDEVFDLLCATFDLTRRERELAALVLDGLATKQLARAMCISEYTVQDHLKAIFRKTGMGSRRELIARLGR